MESLSDQSPKHPQAFCFGSTFNSCRFQGQELRSGLARRFLYYVATGHGNFVSRPTGAKIGDIIELFKPLLSYGGEIDFCPEAARLWEDCQKANRQDMARTSSRDEAALARLNSAPWQTLSIAIIFEACIAAYGKKPFLATVSREALNLAICHVDGCLEAAAELEVIADQATIANDADVLLAKVRYDFWGRAKNGSIILTKTDLTAKFCHQGRRDGSRRDDLYLRWIPYLIRENQARLVLKEGKKEVYAFRVEN